MYSDPFASTEEILYTFPVSQFHVHFLPFVESACKGTSILDNLFVCVLEKLYVLTHYEVFIPHRCILSDAN